MTHSAPIITRFAPSPTGPLHLGHAFSALLGQDMARAMGGKFLLRIEDIDQSRCRPRWENQIYDDLSWLGLSWPQPVLRQSERLPAYRAALRTLWQRGLLYPCTCNRADIAAAVAAPQEGAPLHGPDGLIYPGTCRPSPQAPPPRDMPPEDAILRLDLAGALRHLTEPRLRYRETGPEVAQDRTVAAVATLLTRVGDVVLARQGLGTSYHLSVVLDDAAQGVTHVVRGADLADATFIHVVLQQILGLPSPSYHHHRLIRDDTGKRLAKRDDARSLAQYRAAGLQPDDIRQMLGLSPSAP